MGSVKKKRVMVVDDEKSVLLTYRLILQQEGYEVTACATSQEALDAISVQDFELLLCDLSLDSDANGFDVIARGRDKNPAVPAAILTGYATKEAADFAQKNNITILFKPIDIQEFLTTTSSLLRGKNAGSKEDGSSQEEDDQKQHVSERGEGAGGGSRAARAKK
jgi:DNA-binding NtrC family response regulator